MIILQQTITSQAFTKEARPISTSVAAGVQSAVYGGSVAAGSLFALCQSAGATGVIGSAATAFIGGGTGLAGIAGRLGSFKLFVRLDCLRNLYSNISRKQQNSTTTKLK